MRSTINVGGKDWPVVVPADPLGAVIAATSHSPAEVAASLSERTIAGVLAAFVRVFLGDDAPAVADLANMIEDDLMADRFAVLAWVCRMAEEVDQTTAPASPSNETVASIDAPQEQESNS